MIFMLAQQQADATLIQDVSALAALQQIADRSQGIMQTGARALETATETTNTLFEINTVMGGRLSTNRLTRLNQFQVVNRDLGGLLDAVSGQGDPLRELNVIARDYGGARDMSNVIFAKEYFQNNLFPTIRERGNTTGISIQNATDVRRKRDEAADDAALNTLAISKQQKTTLANEHHELMEIVNEARSNDSLHYQANVQTKLLARIAASLEKLVLLQSQQLDFMAKTYLKDQPVAFTKTGGTEANGRRNH